MTYSLPLRDPPELVQEPRQCWSAAYESWTTACSWIIRGAQVVSEEEIEEQLGGYPDAISEEGGATLAGVGLLQTVGSLQFEAVAGAELSTELLADRLRRFGYIYLIFWGRNRRGEVFSHAVVDSNARGGRMRVMDPGENRGLQTTATSYYRNALAMFIGTHIRAHEA